jgi:putative ABC transport system ATP-binding protein
MAWPPIAAGIERSYAAQQGHSPQSDIMHSVADDPAALSRASLATPVLITLADVSKTYQSGAGEFTALTDINLDVARGAFLVIVGQSGSGKSTMLSLLAGIDRPSTGTVVVDGVPVHALSERQLSAWRGTAVGVVFQFFQLLPTLTVSENVMLPMDFCGVGSELERRERSFELLERLGVADQAHKLPGRLSGGQQQRVAIARALVNRPALLLADEPTGNLDSRNAGALLELLQELASQGQTVIMVTHDHNARERATHSITLADGRIVESVRRANG